MLQQQGPVGGTNGAAVTQAGSAATGDIFAAVNSTSATFVYDTSTGAYSGQSFRLSTAATSVVCNATWTYTAVATVEERMYFKATDWTSTQNAGMRIRAGTTQACRIVVDSTGRVRVQNTSNALVTSSTGSVALSTGTWYRLEVTCTQGASGTLSWAVYDLATETLVDSLSGIVGNYGTANLSESGFGFFTATSNINSWWFAQTATADTGYPIGPGGAAITLANTGTLTDSLSIAMSGGSTPVALSDSSTLTDALTVAVTGQSVALADSSTLTDSLGISVSGLAVGMSNAQTLTDGLAVSVAAGIAMTNTQTMTDGLAITTASAPVGVPFRQDLYPGAYYAIEAAWGANLALPGTWTWYDITPDVMYNPGANWTLGRADESSQSQPAAGTFSLLNTSGNYSAYTATGIYGQNINKGTPIRFRRYLGSGFIVEFQGRMVGATPTFDTTGKLPIVQVVAAGRLKWLGQPKTPAFSPLYRQRQQQQLQVWWPMEDGSASTVCMPGTAATPNLTTATPGVTIAAAGAPGSSASVAFDNGGTMAANVSVAPPWLVTFAAQPRWAAGSNGVLAQWTTSDGATWFVYPSSGTSSPVVAYIAADGVTTSTIALGTLGVAVPDGLWHTYQIGAIQSGANIQVNVVVDDTQNTSGTVTGQTLYQISRIKLGAKYQPTDVGTYSVCALAANAYSGTSYLPLYSASQGWPGESPDFRIQRLAAEDGIPMIVNGSSSMTMGPQLIDSVLANWRDCEKADGGLLYDGLSDGCGYICLSALYNQTAALTIDAGTASALAPPLAPVDDDQRTVNQFTASGAGGSFTVTDSTSPLGTNTIGIIPQGDSYNLATTARLAGKAGWQVNLGTVYGLRYPTLDLNFANTQAALIASTWLAIATSALPLGFAVDVTNVTTSAPTHPPGTIKQIVEGYTGHSDLHRWDITLNAVPRSPYRVLTVADTTHGRVETAGSAVHLPIGAADTRMQIDPTLPWVTDAAYPADFPLNVYCETEEITVAHIGTSIQTNVDGTFESGVGGWSPTSATFVSSSAQAHSGTKSGLLTVTGTPTQAYVRAPITNGYVQAADQYRLTGWLYSAAGISGASVSVDWFTVAGVYISTTTPGSVTLAAATWTAFSFLTTAPATAAQCQYGATLSGSPATGAQIYLDDFDFGVVGRQVFSGLTRSVNGVVLAHIAGAAVSIYQPAVIGL